MSLHHGYLSIATLSLLSVGLAGCDLLSVEQPELGASKSSAAEEETLLSTPPGITLQPLGLAQGYTRDKESATFLPRDQIVYANAKGMTLYTHDKDPAGQSVCVDECARLWPGALAPEGAKAFGPWSVITRTDGTRQWALKGKPLYTYSKDVDIGSVGSNSPKRFGRGPHVGERGTLLAPVASDMPMPEGWRPAQYYPMAQDDLPPDLAINEVDDASGLVLVSSRRKTLYVFDGDPNKDSQACGAGCKWEPFRAPRLGKPKGEFKPISRDDGIKQWTWNGKGLYTYSDDLVLGDANGVGVDRNWQVAYITRNFMPAGVTVQTSRRLGKVLANAEGQTLYRRDAYILQSGSGHNLRRGNPVRPAVGRDIGTEARCGQDCAAQYKPFIAPADAQPQGYWDVYMRTDGKKQWAYQGFALWTYVNDRNPGEINSNDRYHIAVSDDPKQIIDIGTPYDSATALYWAAAIP